MFTLSDGRHSRGRGGARMARVGVRCAAVAIVAISVAGVAVAGIARPAGASAVQKPPSGAVSASGVTNPFVISPTALAFGNVAVGTTSPTQVITVTNVSGSPMLMNGSGGAAGVFGGSQNCQGITLAAGASCQMFYAFSPTAIGPTTGTGGGTWNAQLFSFSFTGTGTNPFVISPTALAFGNVAVGTTSPTQVITVTNVSGSPMLMNGSGGAAGVFGGSQNCQGITLAAGASCQMFYAFSPTAIGPTTGTGGGTWNAQLFSFSFTGTGIASTPAPVVTKVAPNSGPAAGGTSVTIAGTGFSGVTRVAFGPILATHFTVLSTTEIVAVSPAQSPGIHNIYVTTVTGGTNSPVTTDQYTYLAPPPVCPGSASHPLGAAAGIAAVNIGGCPGYFVVNPTGEVAAFGSAKLHGDASATHLNAPIIAITATPDGQGYWLLGADGGIFTYGDAHFYGSTGSIHLNAPVVSMAVTPDNHGYWIIAQDGGVFTYGDARFHGSTGAMHLNAPVDGIAVAPGGDGYWLVASDGGVFTFTTDGFYGSHGATPLNKPVVGMSSTPTGRGYTLVASDGGVFTYGNAPFYGSLGAHPPATAIVDLSPAPADNGYYLVDAAGGVFAFGPGATYLGGA